ncbi:outer membrane protein assembly factor BamB family protein [Thermophilibacter sp.]
MECPTCAHALPEGAVFCPVCGERLPDAVECEDYAYEAFISYRHVPQDERVARRIQRRIEGFRIPSELRTADRQRLGKCFRDEDELPTSGSLPTMLEDALRRARHLIVICSPQMRESKWVAREVELFAAYHGRDRILLALADGEPEAAFPPLLMTRVRREGPKLVTQDVEPVAADLRPFARRRFSAETLRLIAPLVGCGYDDLRQRERTRRTRRLATAACTVAVVTAAFAAFALFQQAQIQANYEAALRRQSEYLADEAGDLLAEGNHTQAAQVALYALGEGNGEERPYVPAARLALEQACQVYPGDFWRPVYANPSGAGISSTDDVCVSSDGSLYAVLDSNGSVTIYDVPTGGAVATIDAPDSSDSMFSDSRDDIAFAGNNLICLDSIQSEETVVRSFNPATRTWDWETAVEQAYSSRLTVSPDESLVAITPILSPSLTTSAFVISTDDGSLIQQITLNPLQDDQENMWLDQNPTAFNEDGSLLVLAYGSTVNIINTETGELRVFSPGVGSISSLVVSGGSLYLGSFQESDSVSSCVISAFGLADSGALSTTPRWSYELPAKGSLADVYLPQLVETFVNGDQQSNLLVMVSDDLMALSTEDGAVTLNLETFGDLSAAHVVANRFLAYVSDKAICTAIDSQNYAGAFNSMAVGSGFNSPYSYGSGVQTGSEGVSFFVGPNTSGSGKALYCLLADLNRTVVYQYNHPYELPAQENPSEEVTAALGGGNPDKRSVDGTYLFSYEYDTTSLSVIDGATFELVNTINLQELAKAGDGYVSVDYAPSGEFDDIIYVSCGTTLYALELPTGTVMGSFECSEIGSLAIGFAPVECDNGLVRLTLSSWRNDTLVTLDARTLEEHSRIPINLEYDFDYIQDLGTLGNRILVATDSDLIAIDSQTGEQVEFGPAGFPAQRVNGMMRGQSQQLDFSPLSGQQGYLTFDKDHEHVLVCDASGTLAQYNANGEKDWELEAGSLLTGTANFLAYLPTGEIFVQCSLTEGSMAQCVLLDAETGETLASSSDVTAIGELWPSPDGQRLFARSKSYGIAQLDEAYVTGVFIINLDHDAFGVESAMTLATNVTPDGQRALFYDQQTDEYFTLPLYSTDELIAHANELVEGHELTGAERRLYHLT